MMFFLWIIWCYPACNFQNKIRTKGKLWGNYRIFGLFKKDFFLLFIWFWLELGGIISMGFKRPLVQIQSLGPTFRAQIVKIWALFVYFNALLLMFDCSRGKHLSTLFVNKLQKYPWNWTAEDLKNLPSSAIIVLAVLSICLSLTYWEFHWPHCSQSLNYILPHRML